MYFKITSETQKQSFNIIRNPKQNVVVKVFFFLSYYTMANILIYFLSIILDIIFDKSNET